MHPCLTNDECNARRTNECGAPKGPAVETYETADQNFQMTAPRIVWV